MTIYERLRLLEIDHTPDGWPAIRTRDISALLDEIERLNSALKYEQHRDGRVGTHGPGCWEWGPAHYECALREIEHQRRFFVETSQSRHEESTKIMQLEKRLALLKKRNTQLRESYAALEAKANIVKEELLKSYAIPAASLHEQYKRTLWDVCKDYGKPGECIFIGFKAALEKE